MVELDLIDIIITSLKGLGTMIGIIGYVIVFNWGWWKISKEKLWEENEGLAALLFPFLFPLGVVLVLITPYVIGTLF